MITLPEQKKPHVALPDWYRALAQYEKPDHRKAIGQLLDTLIPYFALWTAMVIMVKQGVSYGFVLPLIVLSAGLLVRVFIFFHDCGHGSFFASRKANRVIGYLCGVLTFTPFEDWRHNHAGHHAAAGDLDRRGVGDIWTMTVQEYRNASPGQKLLYRVFRNPFVLFVVIPPVLFLIIHRFGHHYGKVERKSVMLTNLALLAIIGLASVTIGLKTYLILQLPIMTLAGVIGVWMFYIQHQFEEVYWAKHEEWDPIQAALAGSSYYRLPKALQWFTGNIGLHHIHHLRPRIANYHLQRCYDETPELRAVRAIGPLESLKSLFLHLWDETTGKLITFRAMKKRRLAESYQR